jgi:hypothetical protein
MREMRNILNKIFSIAIAIIIVCAFSPQLKSTASVYEPSRFVILLVGVKAHELAGYEQELLHNKRIIEVPKTNNWQKVVDNSNASEIIVKQNSGFVGLYTPSGILLKSIDMADGSNPTKQYSSTPVQTMTYQEEVDFGYRVGGRIDPYKPINVYEPKNNARLAAGWGYNSTRNHPESRRGTLSRFLDFSPLDTVTPLNYPGHFDQRNLTFAYGIGVIPHIGALAAATLKARGDSQYYDESRINSGVPNYVEQPVTYHNYNHSEPTNPIVQDPNFMRMNPMPQAFQQDYPGYGNNNYNQLRQQY